MMDFVKAQKILELDARKGRALDAEVQVIALGKDVAWVGLPGEVFAELGMAIEQASPFRLTIVVGLANASLGYIPNRKAYAEGAYKNLSALVVRAGLGRTAGRFSDATADSSARRPIDCASGATFTGGPSDLPCN